jgi:hypothetical protein
MESRTHSNSTPLDIQIPPVIKDTNTTGSEQAAIVVTALKQIIFGNNEFSNDLLDITYDKNIDKIIIHTQQTTQNKYHLRDNYFIAQLKIKVINKSGHYEFHVDMNDLLQLPVIKNTIEKIRQTGQRNYQFKNRFGVGLNISMYEDEIAVGRVIINEPGSSHLSLARLDIFEGYKGHGHGARLMDHVIDYCINTCADLKIDVDKARSKEDDPLVFYSKFLTRSNIKFRIGSDHATLFFDCQAALFIELTDILDAKFPIEFPDSGLSPPQFLAMKHHGLPKKFVQHSWFDRDCYLALQKGITYDELLEFDHDDIGLILRLPVSRLNHFKGLNTLELALLTQFNMEILTNREIYDIVRKLNLDNFSDAQFEFLLSIAREFRQEQIADGTLDLIAAIIQSLRNIQIDVLKRIKLNELVLADTYSVIQKINDEILSLFKQDSVFKFDRISVSEFTNQIDKIKSSHSTTVQFLKHKEAIHDMIITLRKREFLSMQANSLIIEYENSFLSECIESHRSRMKSFYDQFLKLTSQTPGLGISINFSSFFITNAKMAQSIKRHDIKQQREDKYHTNSDCLWMNKLD